MDIDLKELEKQSLFVLRNIITSGTTEERLQAISMVMGFKRLDYEEKLRNFGWKSLDEIRRETGLPE